MGGFERICWILTILASIAALAILGTALFGHQLAAPDQAVLAVAGAGIAIVPYVFTRAIQALGRDARRRAAGNTLTAAPAPAAAPDTVRPLRETPSPSRPVLDSRTVVESGAEPGLSIAAPAREVPAAEPAPPSPAGLVARERLVPPPPPPRHSALERAFWFLIGILVVIIVVGIVLIRNGP